ncbi:MAG: FHA domain-containing protein, partial [Pseudomonadota bacterium]
IGQVDNAGVTPQWVIRDLESLNGVYVNGQEIEGQQQLKSGDVIGLGLSRVPDFEFNLTGAPDQRVCVLKGPGPWTIGRETGCDVPIPADLSVSELHAQLVLRDQRLVIRDLGSRNGLWQGQERHSSLTLQPGESCMIGHHRIRWLESSSDSIMLELSSLGQAIGLRLDQVSIATNEAADPVELSPGQLHVLSVPKASDRAALMQSLGRDGLIDGELYSQEWLGEQIERQRDRVALIDGAGDRPAAMTLDQWLSDEAVLRLGLEVSARDRAALIDTTLEALGLAADGQRRLDDLDALESALSRLAAGLLTRPGLLVFDAGASALDDHQMARLIQQLKPLAGAGLTLAILSTMDGIALRYRPVIGNRRRSIRSLLRRPRWGVLSVLIRRGLKALAQNHASLAAIILLPLVLMMILRIGLNLRSAVIAAQSVLLISTPLSALALTPARDAIPRWLIHRFGLLPDHAIAQSVLAAIVVCLQFTLTVAQATVLLPLDVWTLDAGSQVLLSAAAGLSLGLLARSAARGNATVGLLIASLLGTSQAAWLLSIQPSLLALLGWTALWTTLSLLMGSRSR